MNRPPFQSIFGVDFSGARLAGQNIWIARAEPTHQTPALRLVELHNLQVLAGSAERGPALKYLVEMIRKSHSALWGMDFPFGLPIELFDARTTWAEQLAYVNRWDKEAQELGRWCVAKARTLGDKMHIRRTTDSDAKTPFDCYHYRIIYQTFHGMRDVLLPLADFQQTAVLPFQYAKVSRAERVITEACPSSVLKRLKLPHQNYKQPAGGPLTMIRRRTRKTILDAIETHMHVPAEFRRRMVRNPGGDAIDAALAVVGAYQSWTTADHAAIRRHARYGLEGYVYT